MKDRFSGHAAQYAQFRPVYPKELYDFIFNQIKSTTLAWDAGTGNGQVAIELAKYFNQVIATDISSKQLEQAAKADNVFYSTGGEKSTLEDGSVDLITVAQALHWFDIPLFFNEAKRVLKPNAVIAVWGYDLLMVTPEIDEVIRDFYSNVVGAYWDAERRMVDDRYRQVDFPFAEIEVPEFFITTYWTLAELEGYLTTWSAVQKYIKAKGVNPVDALIDKLESTWGNQSRQVDFPLFMRIGRCSK